MRRGDLILHNLFRRNTAAEEVTDDLYVVQEDDGGYGGGGGDGHSEVGVHISYEDLYSTIIFLACIYVSGQVASRLLRMPSLVGEIFCGILLGPPLADFVSYPEAFVMLGEVGLVVLVMEAGIDIDLSTLQIVGTRGFLIAFFGSFLPIGTGMFLAWMMNVGDAAAIIASGAVFGPTSLGIALNILRAGGILNTPVGQMIVSAAVIDDMIALVVLSMLEVLEGEITVSGILIPIISALGYLFGGGCLCIFVLPGLIKKHILSRFDKGLHDGIEMALMFSLLFVLMPATHYAKASYLMGAFLAGLTFCSSDGLHHIFVRQFKRVLQWLMRIFFSASIGFQVPIQDFSDTTVIWQGLVFCLVLTGKVAVGFMVPNFSQARRFTGLHLKDCLTTGFSMAAEGEFAFVIAVYSVDAALIDKRLYASVVLAVLISTIIPPFCLRYTISYYNRKGEEAVARAAEEEKLRDHLLDGPAPDLAVSPGDEAMIDAIRNETDVFLVIQIQCESRWGLLIKMMDVMAKKHLDVIDHRAWSPRGINTTLVSEVYARSKLAVKVGETSQVALDGLIDDITKTLEDFIQQPDAKVKVQRWFPGVVEEIVEESCHKHHKNIRRRLLTEASQKLEEKQKLQTEATREKTIAEIMGVAPEEPPLEAKDEGETSDSTGAPDVGIPQSTKSKARRRIRQKMRSTPVVGGGLFGESIEARSGREGHSKFSGPSKSKDEDLAWESTAGGVPAEISINGQLFNIRVSQATYQDLKRGFNKKSTSSRRGYPTTGVQITALEDAPVTQMLSGFVRNTLLDQIQEEGEDQMSCSEMSDDLGHSEKGV